MFFPLAVAALAIDTFGQISRIDWLREWLFVPGWNPRIGIMAEHAIVGDGPAEPFVIRTVVTGIHGPIAAVLEIPCQGEFDESIASGSGDVRPRVAAGAHDVFDALLHHVDLAALGVELVPPLI
jgi:hypothetical protein